MTSAEVTPIRPNVRPATGKVSNPEVVARLEELLDRAKSGEIVGIAYAITDGDDYTSYSWVGRSIRGTLGALDLLHFEMCRADVERTDRE